MIGPDEDAVAEATKGGGAGISTLLLFLLLVMLLWAFNLF